MSKSTRLKELISGPGSVQAPGVYDCISAMVVEQAGFQAACISGAAVTASVLGYPDVGLQTMPEILNQARNMARSVEIPLIVDCDTGYGNALNVMRAVREFEGAGLAGAMFEDQTFPKRCGHFEGKNVISTEEMVVKIKAACDARKGDFVIVARTDSRAVHGLDAAIERANAYAEAGADLIFVEAVLSEHELRRVAKEVKAPLKQNVAESGKTPMLHVDELTAMGFKLISYSGTLQRAALRSMQRVLAVLSEKGTTMSAYPEQIASLMERSKLLGLDTFYELEERLYGPILESEGSLRAQLK